MRYIRKQEPQKPIVVDAWKWDETRKMFDELTHQGLPFRSYNSHSDTPERIVNFTIRLDRGYLIEPGDWILHVHLPKEDGGSFWEVESAEEFKLNHDPITNETHSFDHPDSPYVLPVEGMRCEQCGLPEGHAFAGSVCSVQGDYQTKGYLYSLPNRSSWTYPIESQARAFPVAGTVEPLKPKTNEEIMRDFLRLFRPNVKAVNVEWVIWMLCYIEHARTIGAQVKIDHLKAEIRMSHWDMEPPIGAARYFHCKSCGVEHEICSDGSYYVVASRP